MTGTVKVINGMWRNKSITNMSFPLVSPGIMEGKKGKYVTVLGATTFPGTTNILIYIENDSDVVIEGYAPKDISNFQGKSFVKGPAAVVQEEKLPLEGDYNGETEEEAIARINDRFQVLEDMTDAVSYGLIKGMIVTGAPGTGKSFGVERVLEEDAFIAENMHEMQKYEIIRGNVTPIGMYRKMWEFQKSEQVLVFDDSDSVFFDPLTLGLLKVALDTTNKRIVSWNSDNKSLEAEGIDKRFEFKGGIIFITNMNIEDTRSKQLKPHLDALISRSHYLDLTVKTRRDKYLRIKGLVKNSDMLKKYNFVDGIDDQILDYMKKNCYNLRELSLRTALKIADIIKMRKGNNWERLCDITVCK